MKLVHLVANSFRIDALDFYRVTLPATKAARYAAAVECGMVAAPLGGSEDTYNDTEEELEELAVLLADYQNAGIVEWLGTELGEGEGEGHELIHELPHGIIPTRLWSVIQGLHYNDPLTQYFALLNALSDTEPFTDGGGI